MTMSILSSPATRPQVPPLPTLVALLKCHCNALKVDLNQVQLLSSPVSTYVARTVLEPKLRWAESGGVLFQTAASAEFVLTFTDILLEQWKTGGAEGVFQSRPI